MYGSPEGRQQVDGGGANPSPQKLGSEPAVQRVREEPPENLLEESGAPASENGVDSGYPGDVGQAGADEWGDQSSPSLLGGTHRDHVDPRDLLRFAKQILIGLAVIEVLAAAAHITLACYEVKDDVSHQLTIGAIPAAFTLVVGFYFAQRK